jgi:hypothetical protein
LKMLLPNICKKELRIINSYMININNNKIKKAFINTLAKLIKMKKILKLIKMKQKQEAILQKCQGET